MTREEIMSGLKEVVALVKPKLDLSAIGEESNLITDLGIDSLSMLLLSLGIEKKFGLRLDTREPFRMVGEVIDCIKALKP